MATTPPLGIRRISGAQGPFLGPVLDPESLCAISLGHPRSRQITLSGGRFASAGNNDFTEDSNPSYITVVRASFGLSASGAITKFPRVTSLALEPFTENLFSITTNPIWATSMAVTFGCIQLRWLQECYKA